MLPNNDVLYAVAHVHYMLEGPKSRIVFITWAPETASIKRRMLLASSSNGLKNSLGSYLTSVHAGCYPDLNLQNVVEKFRGTVEN